MTTIDRPVLLDMGIEDDPTEQGNCPQKKQKKAKISVKDLQEQIATLQVQLQLAQPDEALKTCEALKREALRTRALAYFLREAEHAMFALYREIGDRTEVPKAITESRKLIERFTSYLDGNIELSPETEKQDASAETFNAEMATTIITDLQQERDQDREYHQQIINDLQEEIEEERQARTTLENEKSNLLLIIKERKLLSTVEVEREDDEQGNIDSNNRDDGTKPTNRRASSHSSDENHHSDSERTDNRIRGQNSGIGASIILALLVLNQQERQARQAAEHRAKQEEEEKNKIITINTRLSDELYVYDVIERHTNQLFSNPNIDSSSKLMGRSLIKRAITGYDDPHTRMNVVLEEVAQECGFSGATAGRVSKKMSKINAWDHHTGKPELQDNGKDWITPIDIALEDIIDHPEQLAFEKHAGGARLRTDKITGEALDTVGIDYSRSQDQAILRMLPGQRGDLDPRKIIQAIKDDRCILDPHAHSRVQFLITEEQKQDAFPVSPILQNDFSADQDQLTTTDSEMTTAWPGDTETKKQDAFDDDRTQSVNFSAELESNDQLTDDYAQIASTKPSTLNPVKPSGRTQRTIRTIQPPKETCTAIYKNEPCGSTKWRWHSKETAYICQKCWTPAKHQPAI